MPAKKKYVTWHHLQTSAEQLLRDKIREQQPVERKTEKFDTLIKYTKSKKRQKETSRIVENVFCQG